MDNLEKHIKQRKANGKNCVKDFEEGFKMLLKIKKQSKLKSLKGKLHWEGNINKMRTGK